MPNTLSRTRPHKLSAAALTAMALSVGIAASGLAVPAGAAVTDFSWTTVANSGDTAPGSTANFNSFNQPSVNDAGLVAFRARTQGGEAGRVSGVYTRDTQLAASPVETVADIGSLVPQPNNLDATFTEFPAFPRIDATGPTVATRGQSSPVWEYTLPDGTDTRVGTSGVYANVDGVLTTGASLLGAVPGQEIYSVPGAPAGTRFDQFPGAPAVDGTTVSFKGNYTEGEIGKTGIFYRDAAQAAAATQVVANSDTVIPGQPAGGTTFGSTAPPSAAGDQLVFLGLDIEEAPTLGGIYLAPTAPSPTLKTLVGIGGQVPGGTADDTFTGFGEGLSFDGRYVAFSGSWGTETTTITLTCPTDGNADLLAYCNETYPNGFVTTVPVNQGIFVYDTATDEINRVTATGETFSGFLYWVFSGAPPGVGGGDEGEVEPPRWRSSSFVAVSALDTGYQVAFKGTPVAGGSGIYLGQGPGPAENIATVVDTTSAGPSIDAEAPAGSVVTSVGLERDGFRGGNLALSVSMLDSATTEAWAGVYLTSVDALTVARLAGVDRFATSAAISAANYAPGVPVAYIASGLDFPDALSGAPVAGMNDGPVLLVLPDRIPDVIQAELDRLDPGRIVILGGTAVVSSAVSTALSGYTTGTVTRLAGVDRFATSAAISAANFDPGVPVVYIASGLDFPDALSGAPVAGKNDSPVLLVLPDRIPGVIEAELERLNPGEIVILGGTDVVSGAVSAALSDYATVVTRLAGVDRFATSAAISAANYAPGVPVVYIASGLDFPDALSGAPVAAMKGVPVLLVSPNSIPDVIEAELERLAPGEIVILGGTDVVSDLVGQQLFSY